MVPESRGREGKSGVRKSGGCREKAHFLSS